MQWCSAVVPFIVLQWCSASAVVQCSAVLHLYGQDGDMTVYSYGSASPLLNIDWSVTSAGAVR